jgi:hypothetical protein
MRHILAIAGAALAVSALAARPAEAYEGPWCAVVSYGNGSSYEDCQYASIEACRPHVLAGNRGFCNPNPRWVATYPPGTKPRARHKRKAQDG